MRKKKAGSLVRCTLDPVSGIVAYFSGNSGHDVPITQSDIILTCGIIKVAGQPFLSKGTCVK